MRIFQKGFNYSQDGPGNRLVYHLQGCNFKCPWCSNPEGMVKDCEKTKEIGIDALFEEILSCRPMFFDGGGVTFTGGEATLQFDELCLLLQKLKAADIDTCIESNGSHPYFPVLWPYIDHLIMDVKHFENEKHLALTGVPGDLVYRNLALLCSAGKEALIRIPLINALNTDADGFVAFFSRHDCKALTFEFLPYHEYGRDKWTEAYTVKNGFITDATLHEFQEKFKSAGLLVTTT